MLAFRGSSFQYFLSVSPQERLGMGDLNCWILEARRATISMAGNARLPSHLEGFGAVAQGFLTSLRSAHRALQ